MLLLLNTQMCSLTRQVIRSLWNVIKLETTRLVCEKLYPIPHNPIDVFNKEVDKLLELGVTDVNK